jgi:hypothetical protein
MDDVTGYWRKLHNEGDKMAGHVARIGQMRNWCKISVGNPEGKRPLGRPGCRWENNVRMNLRKIEWENVDWINLAQDRPVAGSCEHRNETSGCIKGGTVFD